MMRPSVALPTGTLIGLPVRFHGEAALQAFGGAHGDGAHHAVAELLLHFERQFDVLELERLVDSRNRLARELHVDDGADDLGNFACGHDFNSSN